jgi:asparagine synthase (glutamine-hydrolysing)
MSGVFGCWRTDGRPLDPQILRHCLIQISPQGAQRIFSWTDGAVALGSKEPSSSFDQDDGSGDTACVFDGRLDNRGDLIRSLAAYPRVAPDCADRELVAAAYQRFGERFVEHLDGDFVVALFDRAAKRLLIGRDRLGLRPLSYTRSNNAFLFASEAKALLAFPGIRAEVDEIMLADSVLYYQAADSQTRTLFAGIQSLPPGHQLTVTRDTMTVRRYFDFDTTRQIRLPTFDSYAGAFHEVFVTAVTRRLRSARPVAISVSGGLDSAYIFSVAHRALREGKVDCPAVEGFNYAGISGAPSEEERFVAALEEATGARIHRVPQRSGFIECAGDEVWQSESPIVEGLSSQAQAVLGRIREVGAGRFITGHWGDQLLFDSDYLVDLVRSGGWAAARRHSRGWRVGVSELTARLAKDSAARYLPTRLLTSARRIRQRQGGAWDAPWFTPRFRQILRERGSSIDGENRRGTSHARAIHRQSRLGYHVRCMEWNTKIAAMHDLDVAFPYLDRDLIQFLMGIPGEIQSHDGVPRGLMRRAMRGVVPDVIVDRRGKGEFTHLINKSIDDDFAAIAELLGPSALSVQRGLVDGAVLWKLLPEWRQSIRVAEDAVLSNRVIDLCGLEMLLRRFFRNAVQAPSALEAGVATC